MSAISQWQARIPIGQTADGVLIYASDDFYRFLARDVFARLGGVTAPTNNDIDENLLDDSGMAEIEAAMMATANEFGQAPAQEVAQTIDQQQNVDVFAELSERISILEVEINSLKQGVI